MTETTRTETLATLIATLAAAVDAAAKSWTGLDWDSSLDDADTALLRGGSVDWESLDSWIPEDGSDCSRRHYAEIRRCRQLELSDERRAELVSDLCREEREYVEREAQSAADDGRLALAAAKAGDWAQAVRHADDACRTEGQFGDCPTWSEVRNICKRGLALVEADEDESDDEADEPLLTLDKERLVAEQRERDAAELDAYQSPEASAARHEEDASNLDRWQSEDTADAQRDWDAAEKRGHQIG